MKFKKLVNHREQPKLECCFNCKYAIYLFDGDGYCAWTKTGKFPKCLELTAGGQGPISPGRMLNRARFDRVVSWIDICDNFVLDPLLKGK